MKLNPLTLACAALINGAMASTAFAAACAPGTADDFTYRGTTATQCESATGNDSNTITAFGDDWARLAKFDGNQSTAAGTIFSGATLSFGGGTITFSLKFLGDTDNDGWYGYELLANDDPDSILPASMDLVGLVKQGNGYQAYLFESALVDDTGNLGTFMVDFGPGTNAFSHFSLFGGNYQQSNGNGNGGGANGNGNGGGANGNGNGNNVPEPTTLALVGLSLLGVAAARRRRQA